MGYGCFFNDEIWSLFQRLGYVFPVRNVVSNKHTKFEQDRSIFTLLNLGGTQKLPKFMGRGGPGEGEIFSEIQNSKNGPTWGML